MLTELIEPGSADFTRIETAVERAEIRGPDSPVSLTARQVRGLLDLPRRMGDLQDRIEQLHEDLRQEGGDRRDAESGRDEAREEAARLKSQIELLQRMKASRP